jgi:phosphonoacetate hydrolase
VADGPKYGTEIESTTGVNVLDTADTDHLVTMAEETAALLKRPAPTTHNRPYAYQSLMQIFDDPKVPSTVQVHAAGFPIDGNLGNHGALTAVQCRGLLIASGAGVRQQGWINDHGRLVDVAPTLLALLGSPVVHGVGATRQTRSDARLLAQDGDEIGSVIEAAGGADHVVAVVFDGCNTNLVADAIAAGDVPTLAALLGSGTGLRHGIVSSFPTVTLPNHISAFTGVHPGRHGIVNNEFVDVNGEHVKLLSFATMVKVSDWLSHDVETVHEAVHRWKPDAFTSSTYEYAERGATWSTFGEFRENRRPFYATAETAEQTATTWAYESNEQYRFMSRIDESSLGAAMAQWQGPSITGHPLPTLQLVNFSLTDDSGHQVGPHGELARAALIDADRRLGRLLASIETAGVLDLTAVVVLSDHGMEQCDPTRSAHRHADLSPLHAQLGLREVGETFLYPVP